MRKIADDRFKANGDTDACNNALDNIDKTRSKRREERAANLGINPNDHLNGMDQDHAWDYDKLSPQVAPRRRTRPTNRVWFTNCEAVIRSVELIVQPDAHDVVGYLSCCRFTPRQI